MHHWIMAKTIDDAPRVKIFSGGACNILNAEAKLLRNQERDDINDWLTEQGIFFFDPQIHPDTHGTSYNFDVHYPLEQAVRASAPLKIFEISPRTFGGVTALEIAISMASHYQPLVIFFSDGNAHRDQLPAHSPEGYPLFEPYGIHGNDTAMSAHYREMIKNANNMRKYLLRFANELDGLNITFSNQTFEGDIVITPDHMHASDMLEAIAHAVKGERVTVTFTGGEDARDTKGYPKILIPENPRQMVFETMLREYVSEGNLLRLHLSSVIRVDVYVRVVYTQEAAMLAIKDLMKTSNFDAGK